MSVTVSRRMFLTASLAVGGLVLAGCDPAAFAPVSPATGYSETESILYVGHPLDQLRIEALGLFREVGPDLDIEAVEIASDWNGMQVQVGSVLASGERIDILPVATYGLPRVWADAGQLLDLSNWFPAESASELQAIPPALLNTYTLHSTLFGLPLEFTSHGVLVNRSAFVEEGLPVPTNDWTWQDCLELSYTLTRRGGDDARWGWGTEHSVASAEHWLWTNGGPGFLDRAASDFLNPTAGHPQNQSALRWLANLQFLHQVAPGPEHLRHLSMYALKLSGRLAMWMASSLDVYQLEQLDEDLDWVAVAVPKAEATGPSVTMLWSTGLGIAASSRYPNEVVELLVHMALGMGATHLATEKQHMIAGMSEAWMSEGRRERGASVFVDLPRTADIVGDGSLGSNHQAMMQSVVQPRWDAVFSGDLDPGEALQAIDDQLAAFARTARLPQV